MVRLDHGKHWQQMIQASDHDRPGIMRNLILERCSLACLWKWLSVTKPDLDMRALALMVALQHLQPRNCSLKLGD